MELIVKQERFAFGDKYAISVDGVERFRASSKVLRLLWEVSVTDSDGSLALEIKEHWYILRPQFSLVSPAGWSVRLTTKSFWRSVYAVTTDTDNFALYYHRGTKDRYSIFRGPDQVAKFEKDRISIGEGDIYRCEANGDLDPLIVIGLILMMDRVHHSDTGDTSVTISFGNFGPEGKKYDENWRHTI